MISSGRFGIVLFVVCSVTLTETSIILRGGNNQYTNVQCLGLDDVDESKCAYGTYRNPCGKLACANGVADRCDGSRQPFRYGKCAESLFCSCGKCQGCIPPICFQDVTCKSRHIEAKRTKIYPSYPMEYSNNYNEY